MPRPATPLLAVDAVILDRAGRVLLIRRRKPPFEGQLALPGGFVDLGETIEHACRREVFEETGLRIGRLRLVGVYSDPARDPRGHTCAVAYLARVTRAKATAGDDAAAVEWVKPTRGLVLAFDHSAILADALKLARRNRT